MKQNCKYLLTSVFILVLIFSSVLMVNLHSNMSYAKNIDAIIEKDNIEIVANHKNVFDTRRGMMLTARNEGSGFAFANSFSGNFEMDFRVFKDTKYVGFDGTYSEQTHGVKKIKFVFVDDISGQQFNLVIESYSNISCVTPQSYIEYQDSKSGIYYRYAGTYNQAYENTTNGNENSLYTSLWGTSMCNISQSGNYFLDRSDSSIICFEPETMRVYGYSKNEKTLIWDFSSSQNDGKEVGFSLSGFQKYSVKVLFDDIRENVLGRMMIYSLNGQSMAGETIDDKIAPSIALVNGNNAIVGTKFAVEQPIVTDIYDGDIAKSRVTITAPDGTAVDLMGKDDAKIVSGEFAEGCYFVPSQAGDYSVTYEAKDTQGNTSTKEIFISSLSGLDASKFLAPTIDEQYPLGSKYKIDEITATNSFYKSYKALKTSYKVLFGSEEIAVTNGAIDLTKNGVYKLIYTVDDEIVKDSIEYEIVATDKLALFEYQLASSEYFVGEKLTIPQAKAYIGGNKFDVRAKLFIPDGSAYLCDSYVLSQDGVYFIEYSFNSDSKTYTKLVKIVASMRTKDLLTPQTGVTVKANNKSNLSDNINGILVTTKGQGTVEYNKEINFADNTKDDLILELLVTPKVSGKEELAMMEINLVDTTDMDNVLKIMLSKSRDDSSLYSWVKAGTTGNKVQGLYDGVLLTDDYLGCLVGHSFVGYGSSANLSLQTIKISIDYATKCVYANGSLVVDLDNPNHVSKPWKGFGSNEAKMTITTKVVPAEANYTITKIDGMSVAGEIFSDSYAPSIIIDYNNYNYSPNGIVGVKYPIFGAKSVDAISGAIPTKIRVFRNYNSSTSSEFDIDNGSFLPTIAGEYTVEYSAVDNNGCKSVETLLVKVINKSEYKDIEIELSSFAASQQIGFDYRLPSVTAKKGTGRIALNVKVFDPNNKEISCGSVFQPSVLGEYKIAIEAVDFLGNKVSEEATFEITENNIPSFEEIVLPEYIVAGKQIVLPTASAFDFANGGEKSKSDVTVTVNYLGVDHILDETMAFTPTATANNSEIMKVKYFAETADKAYSKELNFEITVVSVAKSSNELDLSKYFQGKNIDSVNAGESNYFEYNATVDAELNYINALSANNLKIDFTVPKLKNNFNKVRVTLTDYADKTNKLAFDFVKQIGKDYVMLEVVGTDISVKVSGTFEELSNKNMTLTFDNANKVLYSSSDISGGQVKVANIFTNLAGAKFHGFMSDKVNLKFELMGVSGAAALSVCSIMNQNFLVETTEDLIKPYIYINGEVYNKMVKGSQLVIPSAYAMDILDSVVDVTVSFAGPNGLSIPNLDPTLEHTYTLSEFGRYTITYRAEDSAGNFITSRKSINVPDTIKPTIVFESKNPESAKLNQKMTLPKYTVADNHYSKEDLTLIIYLINPDYSMSIVDGNEITFAREGIHTIRYYLYDKDYNFVIEDFNVAVKK